MLFFSLLQGVAGTLKLFVLFKNNKVRAPLEVGITLWAVANLTTIHPVQRFLRWHGRMGTLVFASAVTTFLTGVNFLLEGGTCCFVSHTTAFELFL